MIGRYRAADETQGRAAYLHDSGADRLDDDPAFGIVVPRLEGRRAADDARGSNRTPEPNRSCKHHFLRVDPQLRPMLSDGSFGPPQLLKARNVVASIFGLTGATYEPESRRK